MDSPAFPLPQGTWQHIRLIDRIDSGPVDIDSDIPRLSANEKAGAGGVAAESVRMIVSLHAIHLTNPDVLINMHDCLLSVHARFNRFCHSLLTSQSALLFSGLLPAKFHIVQYQKLDLSSDVSSVTVCITEVRQFVTDMRCAVSDLLAHLQCRDMMRLDLIGCSEAAQTQSSIARTL